ncbi:MAG: MBG domain-containing protein, partial [Actinomycetota bacterium]
LGASAADVHGDVSGIGRFDYVIGGQAIAEGDVLPAGTHTLHVEYVPVDGVNHSTASRNVTLVVNKAPQSLVTGAVAATRVYGQTTTLTAGSYSGTGAVTHQVVSGPCSVAGATLATTGAGTCQVRSTIATDANYLPATSTPIAITVQRAPLVVTALNAQRRRATPDPALQHVITGWVGTDDASVLTAPVTVTRGAGEEPGTYAITAAGADVANYAFAYVPGTFTIVEKDFPAITWAAPAAITYGTTLSADQLNPSAAFGGADVPGTYAYAATGAPVALGTMLPAGTHVLTATFTPTNTDDYQSGLTQQVTLTVRRKELTVAGVTAADRLFDETTAAQLATRDA